MLRSLANLLVVVMTLGLFAAPAAARPTIPIREHCEGTVTNALPGTLFFAGEGVGSHWGRYSIEASNDFDAQGNITNGEFTTTAADGSTISGIYSGTYSALPSGKIRFDVTAQWLVGTGRLEGVTGVGVVVAILDGVTPGSAAEYDTVGFLVLP